MNHRRTLLLRTLVLAGALCAFSPARLLECQADCRGNAAWCEDFCEGTGDAAAECKNLCRQREEECLDQCDGLEDE